MRFLLQFLPLGTIADNLERTFLREPLPSVEQGEQTLFLGKPSDEERAFARTVLRTGIWINEIWLDHDFISGKPRCDELVAREFGKGDVAVNQFVPSA